ncbi:hypothetical protein [Pseudoxanthomonas mexicana]
MESAGAHPRIIIDGHAVDLEDVASNDRWALTVGKRSLVRALGINAPAEEATVVFLSVGAFDRWACRQTALKEGFHWPDKLTILVEGLSGAVSGPQLRCCSLGQDLVEFDAQAKTFSAAAVSALVQIAPEAMTRQVGQSLLTKGDLASAEIACLRRWSERDAARLLTDSVTYQRTQYLVTLRGARRVTMALDEPTVAPTAADMELIQNAAVWCFAEHRDARHALLIDRLALDAVENGSFIAFLRIHLKSALQDARDRYRLVVLDKKDTATKETREVLKDVRAQADAYAAKVRDLTSTFLRDLLAALLLIGLGLLGRMSSDTLSQLLNVEAVDAFFRILAGYFIVSATLQVATHWRDLFLTTSELHRWWLLTRSSLPGEEIRRLLNDVIKPRRITFFVAIGVVAVSNLFIALALWNWQTLLASVLPSG